jgi:hypothetical protein
MSLWSVAMLGTIFFQETGRSASGFGSGVGPVCLVEGGSTGFWSGSVVWP